MIEENLLIALEAAINAGSEIMKIYESDNFEIEVDNYSKNRFKMYLFEDEDKVKRKIRLQIVA
jgi:hypothetical protein